MSTADDDNKSKRKGVREIMEEAESRRDNLRNLVLHFRVEMPYSIESIMGMASIPALPSGFAAYCCTDPDCRQPICVRLCEVQSSLPLVAEEMEKRSAANRLFFRAADLVKEVLHVRAKVEIEDINMMALTMAVKSYTKRRWEYEFREAAEKMNQIVDWLEKHPGRCRTHATTLRAIHEEFKTYEPQEDAQQLYRGLQKRLSEVSVFLLLSSTYNRHLVQCSLTTAGLIMASFGICKPLYHFRATLLSALPPTQEDETQHKRTPLLLMKRLGEGSFSDVFQFDDTTFIKVSGGKYEICLQGLDAGHLQQELEVLKQLDHPAIPRPLSHELESIELELENYPKIDRKCLRLQGVIEEESQQIPGSCVQSVVDQMLSALEHAHSRNIVHLDVKRSNIVVADLKDGVCRAQLIDWGCAVEAGKKKGAFVGSPSFAHEELFNLEKEGRTWITDPKHDHASLGFTVACMLGRRPSSFASGQIEKKKLTSRSDDCMRVIRRCPREVLDQTTRDLLIEYIRPSPKVLPPYDVRSGSSVLQSSQLPEDHRTRERKRKSPTT